jgi:hypothetical protein
MSNEKFSPGESFEGKSGKAVRETEKGKEKKPTTVEEALDQGYKQKNFIAPSDPPVLFFEKDGEVISIRPKPNRKVDFNKFPKGKLSPGQPVKAAKGGLMEATAKLKAKGLKDGGEVIKDKIVSVDKSPNSGMITQRGWGASRKT